MCKEALFPLASGQAVHCKEDQELARSARRRERRKDKIEYFPSLTPRSCIALYVPKKKKRLNRLYFKATLYCQQELPKDQVITIHERQSERFSRDNFRSRKGRVILATFSRNFSRSIVALQVARITTHVAATCCAEVDVSSTLIVRHFCGTSCKKILPYLAI